MTVFRWIMGVLGVLFASGWIFCLMLYVLRGDDRFSELGTKLRRFTFAIVLLWFDIEVWGRVIWTLITW
jgi:hypothetical protein